MSHLALVLILASAALVASSDLPLPRIIDGKPVDTLRRFPHHVTIKTTSTGLERQCSGSIIFDEWILTSISCVGGGERLQIDFNRLWLYNTRGSFSVSLDDSNVHVYPTNYDDLALVRLPVKLIFSDTLRPIALISKQEALSNLVVMAGFGSASDRLTYGMFSFATQQECKAAYPNVFDEFLHICTKGWNGNTQVPCDGNQGGGLISSWPTMPRLAAVFSSPLDCKSGNPAVYTKVSEYFDWIAQITGKEINGGELTPN